MFDWILKKKAKKFNKRFLRDIRYLNKKIFDCTNSRFVLYESFKKKDPDNPNFNMDLSDIRIDDVNFSTVCRSVHLLVMKIAAEMTDEFKRQYKCIGRDFSTLFCTLYKSFTSLVDVTYFLGWYYNPVNTEAGLKCCLQFIYN